MAKQPYRKLLLGSIFLASCAQGVIWSIVKLPVSDSSVSCLELEGHSFDTESGFASELHHKLSQALSPSVTLLCFSFLFVNEG